jgi:2-phospho-L-lactate guanylyltransferase
MTKAWAVLPVKDMRGAKQRLSAVLARAEREALFRAMLEDVLEALAGARLVAGILVVTRDVQAARLARAYGAEVIGEDKNAGQTLAVTVGVAALAARGVRATVSIPGDVPLVTPDELDAVIAAHGEAPAVTIAPAHDRLGSNAIVCSPPGVLPLRFGDASFEPHLERARSLGIEPRIIERAGLGLDIDHPADLRALLEVGGDTRAHRYLARIGAAARLGLAGVSRYAP